MPSRTTSRGRIATLSTLAALAVAGIVATTAPHAQTPASITYVIKSSGAAKVANLDAAPRGFTRGRFSLGDQITVSEPVTRDGKVRGTSQIVATVVDRAPVPAERAHAYLTGVYRLADGNLYFQGAALFDDAGTGSGAITGGTGAYAGARGTITSTATGDRITILPN